MSLRTLKRSFYVLQNNNLLSRMWTSFGEKISKKNEGEIPYYSQCASFRFPVFNTAISAMLFNKNHDRILLIKQYDMTDYILLGWLCVSRGKCRDNCGA